MLDLILANYHQAREALEGEGMKNLIRKRVFQRRVATPVEMDLSPLHPPGDLHQDNDYRLLELKLEEVRAGKFTFGVSSRRYKASRNLEKGLRGFAAVKGAVVVGDLWCVAPSESRKPVTHPDLEMLGIRCAEGEAYAFDMLIDPTYRGKNLAVPLQRYLQWTLKAEGCQKIYGFYWDDNLPALWMHRMLKFKELPKRRVSRFFFLQTAGFLERIDPSPHST